ncbi:MAG: dTMP kinase [Bdellovibrionales bacterium]
MVKRCHTQEQNFLLYQASRAQHVEQVIRPALQENKWVLCDRYTSSSLAFQAGGRSIEESDIKWLNDFATGELYRVCGCYWICRWKKVFEDDRFAQREWGGCR